MKPWGGVRALSSWRGASFLQRETRPTSFQQNGIKEIHSFAEKPTYDMPVSTSGRMYFYIVTDPPDPPASATDPSQSNYHDFIEHTISATVYNGNTTRVDRWSLKIAMKLNAENGSDGAERARWPFAPRSKRARSRSPPPPTASSPARLG